MTIKNLVLALSMMALQLPADAAEIKLINRNWKYCQGDIPEAEKPDFNDTGWQHIGLPHSFSIPYFMSKDFYSGYGWYRHQLHLSDAELKGRTLIEFGAVFRECELYVNGEKAGSHTGGYTTFRFDISRYLKPGDNIIAVRVNNLWRPDVAPRAGEHTFSGGIYRDVRLVRVPLVAITPGSSVITTTGLAESNGKKARVHIVSEVQNQSARQTLCLLETSVLDPEGRVVAKAISRQRIEPGTKLQIEQQTAVIGNPRLWSPDSPALYKVVSRLYNGKTLIDTDENRIGFRWMKWTADKGFYLNGRHFYLRGANVHQDQAGWGDAVTDSAAWRDVRMMKEAGFNFIRGSHYPHSDAFVEACDALGMLFWSEAPFWGIGGFRPDGWWNSSAYPVDSVNAAPFESSALEQLEEMIKHQRNHPSIAVWSMSNEPFFSDPKAMSGVRRLLKRMVDLSHKLDPTRPAAVGGAQRPLGNARIDRIGDIAGYNGDGATQPDFQQPGVPSIVSEYGSTTADRPGQYAPGWGDLARNDAWRGLPWRSGQAIWCGFDHGSIAGAALGKMGIVDYFRLPKRSWYWYRHAYTGVKPPEWPVEGKAAQLRLTASKTKNIGTDGTDDVQLIVTVCDSEGRPVTSSPTVTLKILSGPGELPTGRSITFASDSDIRIAEGKAAIAMRAYYAGSTVVEATAGGLAPARLQLHFTGPEQWQEGVTPLVSDRPYHRFVRQQDDANSLLTLGVNNPTFATSSSTSHPVGMAADGLSSTYWQPSAEDSTPGITLDMEKLIDIVSIHVSFADSVGRQFRIETSADGTTWTTVSESKSQNPQSELTVNVPSRGRYVRLVFNTRNPKVSEISVKGRLH